VRIGKEQVLKKGSKKCISKASCRRANGQDQSRCGIKYRQRSCCRALAVPLTMLDAAMALAPGGGGGNYGAASGAMTAAPSDPGGMAAALRSRAHRPAATKAAVASSARIWTDENPRF